MRAQPSVLERRWWILGGNTMWVCIDFNETLHAYSIMETLEPKNFDFRETNRFRGFFLHSFLICFQSCVIYQLRSGSIVYQSGALSNALDGPCRRNLTQLDEMMRKTFTSDIEQQSGVGGKAMCCKSNACNAAIPKVTKNLLCSSLPSFLCACTYFRPFLLCSYAET